MNEYRIVAALTGFAGAGMLVLGHVLGSSFLAAVASLPLLFTGYFIGRDCTADREPIDFDAVNEKIRHRNR